MSRNRGFVVKHRVNTLCRRVFREGLSHRLTSPQTTRVKPLSGMTRWANKLGSKAKAILSKNMDPRRKRKHKKNGREELIEKPDPIPKGYMAVYVGQEDGEFERFLVPVVHFNHPLFGDLLKESENKYGFDQPGGIAIPCRVSDFERVQTRIKTVQGARNLSRRKSSNRSLYYEWIMSSYFF